MVNVLNLGDLDAARGAGAALLDIRSPDRFAAGHLPGSYWAPVSNRGSAQWALAILPPKAPVILVADAPAAAERAAAALAETGITVEGVFTALQDAAALQPMQVLERLEVAEAKAALAGGATLVDVREPFEWSEGRYAQARLLSLGQIAARISELEDLKQARVVVTCAAGVRSVVAASVLQARGFSQVQDLRDGMHGWMDAGLPVTTGRPA